MEREELVERLRELKDYINQKMTLSDAYDMSRATFDLWVDREDALEEAIEAVQALSKKSSSK